MAGTDIIQKIQPIAIVIIIITAMFLLILAGLLLSIVLFPLLKPLSGWMDALVNKTLIPLAIWAISLNPDVGAFSTLVSDIIKMLSFIYIVAIVLTGIYIILLSASPESRAKAKSMLLRLLFGMIIVSVSMPIYTVLLDISGALTRRILASLVSTGGTYMAVSGVFILLGIYVIPVVVIGALISIGLRYVVVSLMAVLFPITIFLYFFEWSRDMGASLVRITIMMMITQIVMALMLVISLSALNSVAETQTTVGQLMSIFIGLAGFIGIAVAPLMTMGALEWLGGSVAGYGMALSFSKPRLGGALVALGGLGAGMGPEAMVVGYSAKTLGGHYLETDVRAQQKAKFAESYRKRTGRPPTWEHMEHAVAHAGHELEELKTAGITKGWSSRKIAFEKQKLSFMDVPGAAELDKAKSMIPYPLYGLYSRGQAWGDRGARLGGYLKWKTESGLGRLAEHSGDQSYIGRKLAGYTENYKINTRMRSIDKASDSKAVADEMKKGLKELGMSDKEADQLGARIEADSKLTADEIKNIQNDPKLKVDPNEAILDAEDKRLDAAKDKAKSLLVYSKVKKDSSPYNVEKKFFRTIKNGIMDGDPEAIALGKEKVAEGIEDYHDEKIKATHAKFSKSRSNIEKKHNNLARSEEDRLTQDIQKADATDRAAGRETPVERQNRLQYELEETIKIKRIAGVTDIENDPQVRQLKQDLGISRSDVEARQKPLNDLEKKIQTGIKEDIESDVNMAGGPKTVGKPKMDATSHAAEAAEIEKISADKETAVEAYLKDYDDLTKVHGSEKGSVYATIRAYQGETAADVKAKWGKMSPEEKGDYEKTLGDIASIERRMDIGSNLHARMLLEDYMGIGPRPSEFYTGVGKHEPWELKEEKKKELREGDEDTWEKI
jgi:hypothetical protein